TLLHRGRRFPPRPHSVVRIPEQRASARIAAARCSASAHNQHTVGPTEREPAHHGAVRRIYPGLRLYGRATAGRISPIQPVTAVLQVHLVLHGSLYRFVVHDVTTIRQPGHDRHSRTFDASREGDVVDLGSPGLSLVL